MTSERRFSDAEAESLLGGRAPASDDLSAFLVTTKALSQQAPDEATQARHLAAIAEATSEMTTAARSAPRSRSREMIATIFRPRWAKVAAGVVGLVFATGGLAAADVLPDPAQDVVESVVASVAGTVGIDLPFSEDKVKTGMDHDGDGVADDNGKHTGQTGEKTGMDHDGDGVPDDNGKRGRGTEDESSDGSGHGKSVSDDVADAKASASPGPGRGKAVSDAASQNRQDDEHSNRPDAPADEADGDEDGDEDEEAEPDDDRGPPDDKGSSAGKGRSDDRGPKDR